MTFDGRNFGKLLVRLAPSDAEQDRTRRKAQRAAGPTLIVVETRHTSARSEMTGDSLVVWVSKEKASENREALLRTAGRLLRERGFDGVGVAEIAREAGLTHGALYAHFPSKEVLATEAFAQGLAQSRAAIRAAHAGRRGSVAGYLDYLISADRRDAIAASCPMTASASEAGRQGPELSAKFVEGFQGKAAAFEAVIDADVPAAERRRLAQTIVAAEIGAIAAARAVAKSDPALSDEILASVRAVLGRLAGGEGSAD